MSALDATNVLRPVPAGLKGWLTGQAMAAAPMVFRLLRRVRPILRLGSTCVVTLHDDVREVFENDLAFGVPYAANIAVLTGGDPFFLGLPRSPEYFAQRDAMRAVVLASDLPALADRAEALAESIVAAAPGEIDVVDLVRRVSFTMIRDYFGVPEPETGRIDVWATRLFEFQFAGSPRDTALRAEVDVIAPAFRAHLDRVIAERKAAGSGRDDILGRCLARQARGEAGYDDADIRTAILCMVVGGPPQPPMVVPQAMEQLLRRPEALALARARLEDDTALMRILREAMRFDPLAPGLPRVCLRDQVIAAGTARETRVPEGSTVIVAFASAMMDANRLPEPDRFDPDRLEHEYIHFGHGLHECFGKHINEATLHRMVRPLLRRTNLRRAPGPAGHLTKAGIFANSLTVRFDS